MQQAWRREVTAALDQALAETSRLAERELDVQQAAAVGRPAGSARAGGAGLGRGRGAATARPDAEGVGEECADPPGIGSALGGAQQQMQQVREAIANSTPNTREGADQAGGAVDALNSAVYQLLQARGDVSSSASGSGLAEAIERMDQLAQQQGGLGKEGAGLLPMAGNGAIQEQLRAWPAGSARSPRSCEAAGAGGASRVPPSSPTRRRTWRGVSSRVGSTGRWSSARSGSSAACWTPAGRCRGRKRTSGRNGRASPRPTTASISRPRCGPGCTGGRRVCAFRRGRSCNGFRRGAANGGGLLPALSTGDRDEAACVAGVIAALAPGAAPLRAQQEGIPRAFDSSAVVSTRAAADAYRAISRGKPADPAALLGLERVLVPLNRTGESCPRFAPRSRRIRERCRSTVSLSGLGRGR